MIMERDIRNITINKNEPEIRHILRSAVMLNGRTQGLNQRSLLEN